MWNKLIYGIGCGALILSAAGGCSATVPDGDEPRGDLVKIEQQRGMVSRKDACNIVATDLTSVLMRQSQTNFSIGLADDEDEGLGKKALKELGNAMDFFRDSPRVATFRLESSCQSMEGEHTEWFVQLIRRADGKLLYTKRLKLAPEELR